MAAKKKAAKVGSGAVAAGAAARQNQYVQRLLEDPELRENLRTAYDSARKAYGRMNGKGPTAAIEDKKVQRELKQAASSLKDAAESLREKPKRRKKRRGRLVLIAIVGAAVAIGVNEGLRKKVLDALFGAEEEFEYTSTTTPASGSAAPVTAS